MECDKPIKIMIVGDGGFGLAKQTAKFLKAASIDPMFIKPTEVLPIGKVDMSEIPYLNHSPINKKRGSNLTPPKKKRKK